MAFKRDLLEKIRALPGVEAAAQAGTIPLSGSGGNNEVWIDGGDSSRKLSSNFAFISDGYLKTMGMPLLTGRDFDSRDTPASPGVALVNQSFARQLGLGENPVGKRFRREATPSNPEVVFEIVGLVLDTKYYKLVFRHGVRRLAAAFTAEACFGASKLAPVKAVASHRTPYRIPPAAALKDGARFIAGAWYPRMFRIDSAGQMTRTTTPPLCLPLAEAFAAVDAERLFAEGGS